jgi:1-acyl-sn-glycerol-3-phosphate acyltransferase
VEDLFLGLVERFVADVVIADPAGWERVRGRSCLYLANHQVGVESLLFSMIVSALSGAPAVTLAKDEHRESWIGQLIRRSFNYPGVVDPGLISFFTREDPTSLARILHEFAAGMGRGRGVIVHVEGTRALACRRPVTSLSSAFLDMALSVGAPVVPVRFVGGLPVAEMQRRIDFPVGFGSQQIWIGSPIEPDALRAMTLKQRKERVLAAINGVGPPVAEEVPGAPDLGFAARVADWGERAGVGLARATLLAVLDGPPEERSAATNRLIAAVDSRRAITGEAPADRWLAELAGWLTERG